MDKYRDVMKQNVTYAAKDPEVNTTSSSVFWRI